MLRVLSLGAVGAVAACSGSGGSGGPAAPAEPNADLVGGRLILTLPQKTAARRTRHPYFVSPSASSVSITVSGIAQPVVADVSPTSTECSTSGTTRSCSIALDAPAGNDTFTATLYTGAGATGTMLGTGSTVQEIGSGPPFTITISISGDVVSIKLSAAQKLFTVGVAATTTVTVMGLDAGNNVIVGSYESPISLTNSDTTGTFTLSPASVSDSSTVVTLAYSGGTAVKTATISASAPNVPAASVSAQIVTVGTPTPSPVPTPTPTPGAPTPTPSPTPATTPTATPTPGGSKPTPSPSPTETGKLTCTQPNEAVPGIYTTVITTGNVVGNTYTGDPAGAGYYDVVEYSSPTPVPVKTPTPTPSPSPTVSPTPTATPRPTATPAPIAYTTYYGTFSLPGFTGFETLVDSDIQYTASTTNGCFTVVLAQPVGGKLGQVRVQAPPGPAPTDNTFTIAEPQVRADTYQTPLDSGLVSSVTLTNLTPTTGSGSFTLANGVTGTANVVGSVTFVFASGRVQELSRHYWMLYNSAKWYEEHARRRR